MRHPTWDAVRDPDPLVGTSTQGPEAAEEGVTKDFFLVVFRDLKKEILTIKSDLRGNLQEMLSEVREIRSKFQDVKKSLNEQVDDSNKVQQCMLALERKHDQLQDKCEDLKNRSRRNKVHIRRVPLEVALKILLLCSGQLRSSIGGSNDTYTYT
ncbi:hypothetical protein NDU88_005611 [Pleurodeles waltl]|uniref:Uncharacterized protein n=1 Tax=Pleurodeles waltl TaxID=8319 RepID=A0AAV7MBR1_PLEWA|nr:hypothetical protein NDU88_005611 [Pleurodeles waltl]